MNKELKNQVNEFRNGIFSLNTRRFGTLAEEMIQVLFNLNNSNNLAFDKKDSSGAKIEIKFSTVMKENTERIRKNNAIQQAINANFSNRAISSTDNYNFDCNIQQIKTKEFDILYYGLFFTDIINIYKINSTEVKQIPGYSNKQHRGNEGEGQFHINNQNISYHKKYLVKQISYEDLYEIFS